MERNLRKERVGKVVSNKMTKSITIAIDRKVKHPKACHCLGYTKLGLPENIDKFVFPAGPKMHGSTDNSGRENISDLFFERLNILLCDHLIP